MPANDGRHHRITHRTRMGTLSACAAAIVVLALGACSSTTTTPAASTAASASAGPGGGIVHGDRGVLLMVSGEGQGEERGDVRRTRPGEGRWETWRAVSLRRRTRLGRCPGADVRSVRPASLR